MRTVLYERHCQLGAKIIDFAGWEMPLHYTGIIQEHLAVRKAAGLFDVSHMGRIVVSGRDAAKFLDDLCTNQIENKKPFSATYTVLCHVNGGAIDDVIVYRQEKDLFFLIVNAANRQKDLNHLRENAKGFDLQISERFEEEGILSLQGPLAIEILAQLFPSVHEIKDMHFGLETYSNQPIILSHTGYTGSGGFEMFAPLSVIGELWDKLLALGASKGLVPVGLGARDTLRLEMGYALYGHELTDQIAPTESVSAWTVKTDKHDFKGKQALEQLEGQTSKRSEYGVVLLDKGIAREGYPVFHDGKEIGVVTSGTFGPSLNKAIAIILVQDTLTNEAIVEIEIRDHRVRAQVVKLPFLKKRNNEII